MATPAAGFLVFQLLVTLAAMWIRYRQAQRMRREEAPDLGLGVNSRSTEEVVRVIYGQMKVGGNDVYIGSSGDNNKNLWIVQTLCEGEIDSFAQGENDDGDTVDQVYLDDEFYTEFGTSVEYTLHTGSDTQVVDSDLSTAFTDWADPLKHTAYIVWKLIYDPDKFQGPPQRTAVVKGRKLYDFRNDVTAYENNPVLCLYDFMTNTRYGLGHTITASNIDTTSWTSAANYCDTKGWGFNYAITSDTPAHRVIDLILRHFRGTLVWYDNKFYLRYADVNDESSVMTLTDSHIAQNSKGRAQIQLAQPSRFKRPTGVRVAYMDADKDYVIDHVMIGTETGTIDEVSLIGASSRQMASDLGTYELERRQLDKSITGLFRDDALKLEPHDLITFNSDALSISGQLMRVVDAQIQPTGLIRLGLQYEATALYDDDYNLDTDTIYSCTLPDPRDVPPEPGNITTEEETYYYRLRTFTRLKVSFSFDPTYPWLKHVEVWQSFDNITWNHLFNVATNDFQIDPVAEEDRYYLKLVTVNILGVKNDGSVIDTTISGDTAAPPSIDALVASVNENTVNLWANKLTDPDIDVYEFRLGGTWTGAVHLASLKSPNVSLVGVKPGTHTFWCNTLGNNDVYGDTPRSATAVLRDPPDGWTVQSGETQTEDYL
jgi:hypothetical protein